MKRLILLAAVAVSTAFPGGFWITVSAPPAGSDAIAVVQMFQCGNPTGAKVSGTAEGVVNGKRESLPLEFRKTATVGLLEVMRPKMADGKWVLAISAALGDWVTNDLVPVSAGGKVEITQRGDKPGKYWAKKVGPSDVDALLAYAKR